MKDKEEEESTKKEVFVTVGVSRIQIDDITPVG